jgi:hypothetical protein
MTKPAPRRESLVGGVPSARWPAISTGQTICSAGRREVRTDKMIGVAVQWAELIMKKVDVMVGN